MANILDVAEAFRHGKHGSCELFRGFLVQRVGGPAIGPVLYAAGAHGAQVSGGFVPEFALGNGAGAITGR